MLARRRNVSSIASMRTPMLVPSFSSKSGSHPHAKVEVDHLGEIMTQPALISAYDLFYQLVDLPSFPTAIFIDSGGYEANRDVEAAKYGDKGVEERPWTEEAYKSVLTDLPESVPYIAVSFDHPNEPLPLPQQIDRAISLYPERADMTREFLIKPEPVQQFVDAAKIISQVDRLADFPIIGLTDKELGATMMERLVCVGKLRQSLSAAGFDTPIHIFGSLDPLTTPLYFLAGADIFDGLAWLRYGFSGGRAVYPQNFHASDLDLHQRPDAARAAMWHRNYFYLVRLEDQMKRFLKSHDFDIFEVNSTVLENAWTNLAEHLGAE